MNFLKNILVIFIWTSLFSCTEKKEAIPTNFRIAFLADVHFQDIYASFSDANYKGVKNKETGEFVNIRTMKAQLKSTRIFNENYFAFLAALEDISKKGIKHVVLPGDFSDDGQPIHVKGLTKILEAYSKKHGMSFFATTGNHDPVRPFSKEGGKSDFLGEGGKEQAILSSVALKKDGHQYELKPIFSSEIKNWGYKEILNEMHNFGFFPKAEYVYWETPFSNYSYEHYSLKKALEQSGLERRSYPLKNKELHLPDVSYLVEPVEGIWLLAIDANVYVPQNNISKFSENPKDFSGASIGYNKVLLQKSHLIDWVKKVASKAQEKGKVLIAFSHYPMVDFNDDASEELKTLFGDGKLQLHRVPNEDVAKTFADAGLKIHFGGHMHINDTGVRTTEKKHTLFNIQTPSLAAYVPAYKLLTIQSATEFEVETIVIDSVAHFNRLFSLYEKEYKHLQEIESKYLWNKEILTATNYKDFTALHLSELVRLRFLINDWSPEFLKKLSNSTGKELLLDESLKKKKKEISEALIAENLSLEMFEKWTGLEMILAFYKLRSADELAIADIGEQRLAEYLFVCKQLKMATDLNLSLWGTVFFKTANGQPSNHFKIDLKANTIHRVKPRNYNDN
ncbi:metallophosphoesterase family protein [Flavicella sediminum]|uniref:metallophosphoesterase family protein n=1 Tax=Flavicella sediminum TaxID=2585141 RepID=UPI001124A74A|nr:metallophosphoesterase [Flavicella sediminum]